VESPGKKKQSSELEWGAASRDMAYGVQSLMFISMVKVHCAERRLNPEEMREVLRPTRMPWRAR
jgi:hypothetical protein